MLTNDAPSLALIVTELKPRKARNKGPPASIAGSFTKKYAPEKKARGCNAPGSGLLQRPLGARQPMRGQRLWFRHCAGLRQS